jgi:hypothetical protein
MNRIKSKMGRKSIIKNMTDPKKKLPAWESSSG